MNQLRSIHASKQTRNTERSGCIAFDPELRRIAHEEASGARQQPKIRRFDRGSGLVVQGETPAFLGVLRRGYVRQERLRPDGNRVLFGLACPGDMVGGLPGIAATCASEAASDVEICVFGHDAVERLMLESPRFRETYLRETQRQHHRLLGSAWRLNALDSRERIIAFLVDATQFMPTDPLPDGSLVVTIEVSRGDWADLTNTAVETISRTMRYLAEKEMVVSLTPFRFRIWNVEKLARLAGIDPPHRPGPRDVSEERQDSLFASPESEKRMMAINAPKTTPRRVAATQSFMIARDRAEGKRRSHHVEEKVRN